MRTLREIRAEKFMSIRDLATQAGVAAGTIVRAESGAFLPRFVTMRKIAAALGVEPGEIAEFAAAVRQAAQGKSVAQSDPRDIEAAGDVGASSGASKAVGCA